MPDSSLPALLRPELARHPPFAQMMEQAVDFFISRSEQRYYASGEALLEPASGPVRELFWLRQGGVTAGQPGAAFEYEAGDLFPIGAALAGRAVSSSYRAAADTFVLVLPAPAMRDLAQASPEFAAFLQGRVGKLLELSREALQAAYASQALAEHSLETPLAALRQREPLTCAPATPLRAALEAMQRLAVGSIVVTGEGGAAAGILTRDDLLARVVLAGVPLDAPVARVMSQPVHTLDEASTAQDAALLMARHGIRHVPLTRGTAVVGVVSERDLFALQRLSLKQVSGALRGAVDLDALRQGAQDISRFARNLLAQGVQARQLTAQVSHLNDLLTQRLLQLLAPQHGVALAAACWVALGSEGRSEQTIATDQDNALVLPDGLGAEQRAAWLAFGRAANQALADCGFPLCRGGIMAGEPECCLSLREWRQRFGHWIEHGAPEHLLRASIFFDMRPLAGHAALVHGLQADVLELARGKPRFLHQLAVNALGRSPPLNWLGGFATDADGCLDLKLQGSAIFTDAARIYALAHGIAATGTRERLELAGSRMGLPASEYEAWTGAFEFLQLLRLRVQLEGADPEHPNRLRIAALNDIDRRILRESLRFARRLQQRLQLDYER